MAKTKISEYSSTAGSNTDINSINLAEGMAPSLVNNAIRQLMAQLKDFQTGSAGDSLTVGGNLSVTGTSTLTGAITATAGVSGPITSTSATITGGTINGTVIGGSTPQTITGTTVTANTGFVGALTGNVTGNLTGNSAGTHTGAVTGNVTGNLTGNVTASSGTSTFNDVTINGTLDMASGTAGTITGLATPSGSTDAATKGYVDGVDATKLNLAGGTMTGNIAMGGYKVTGLGTPTADADAVTKSYVDAIAQGIDAKASCKVATTANITLSSTQTIDGIAVSVADRVLVKNQTTSSENGIYVVASGSWTRATDADSWTELVSAYTFVEQGTANGGNGYLCTVTSGGTLGTTAVTFTQFSGAGQITAGAGMTKTGNTLDVATASSSRIVVNADNIDLATTGVSASTYKSVTVDTYGRVTAGTNPTTISGFGITDAYTKTEVDTTTSALLPKAGGTMTGNIVMGANKVTSTATPTTDDDLTRKAYVDSILGSATAAATSAAAAATSASSASTSATNASTSAGEAATSAAAAAASYDSFDDRYLGSKSSAPTTDNDGAALLEGAIYWNSTSKTLWVWNGSAWTQATLTAGSFATLAGTETLTNKTIAYADNTLTGVVGTTATQTLTNKTITYADNTLTGVVGTTATQTLTNKTIEAGTFTNGYTEEVATANTSTAYTIDLANGSVQILTLTGNCTFTFPTATAGKSFIMILKQDGTGSRTVTWPAAVKWPGGTAPTITSTASKADKYVFTADGTSWLGSTAGLNYTV